MNKVQGYLSYEYVSASAEHGRPRRLPRCGGWILERRITGTSLCDAMGAYPLFACRNWSGLSADLDEIGGQLVSLVLVTDPFGAFDRSQLSQCFPDRLLHFKDHMVVDLAQDPGRFVVEHHRRNARKALSQVEVDTPRSASVADDWQRLYEDLVQRHDIRTMAAFSPESLRRQLDVPGTSIFCARADSEIVGMTIWYEHQDVAYYHLGAYTDAGYERRASFAIFWQAIEEFRRRGLKWLDLGAGAGVKTDGDDGLTRFKRGWATGTRPALLCGRIFDPAAYRALTLVRAPGVEDYFPSYRKGEFA